MSKLLASLRKAFVMDELPAWSPNATLVVPEHAELVYDALPTQRQEPDTIELDAIETAATPALKR